MHHVNIGLAFTLTFCSWIFAMIYFAVFKNSHFVKSYRLPLFIKSKAVNKAIGVYLTSFIITKTFVKHFNPRVYLTGKNVVDYHRVLFEMQYAAKTHFFAFICVLIVSAVLFFRTLNLSQFLVDVIMNIILNIYPVLALQLQGNRLAKIVQRKALTAPVAV